MTPISVLTFGFHLLHMGMRVGEHLLARTLVWHLLHGKAGVVEKRLLRLGIKVKCEVYSKGRPVPSASCKGKGGAMGLVLKHAALLGVDALWEDGELPETELLLLRAIWQMWGDYYRSLCHPVAGHAGWAELRVRGLMTGHAVVVVLAGAVPTSHEAFHHGVQPSLSETPTARAVLTTPSPIAAWQCQMVEFEGDIVDFEHEKGHLRGGNLNLSARKLNSRAR